MLADVLGAIEASPFGAAIRASRIVYPLVNAAHILGLGTLFGAILALDLRLLGVMRRVPLQPLALVLPRVAGGGLVVAIVTGALLFAVQPREYASNAAFLAKVTLVGAGLAHVAYVHRTKAWQAVALGGPDATARLRVSAAVSLTLWTAAIVAGRFIAFE